MKEMVSMLSDYLVPGRGQQSIRCLDCTLAPYPYRKMMPRLPDGHPFLDPQYICIRATTFIWYCKLSFLADLKTTDLLR